MSALGLRLRESPRVAIAGRARLLFGAAGMTVDSTVLDLSTSGMGLATAVAAPKPSVGDTCAFELTVDGVRIEGRGVVVWSRRARPDRGDAPNVGVLFRELEGTAFRDLAALVEPRLASGRWSGVAEPMFAASVAVDPLPEVASAPAQQLTLTAPTAAPPPAVEAPPAVAPPPPVATVEEKPPQPVPREPASQKPAPEPVAQATRPELTPRPSPSPPLRNEAFENDARAGKSRAVMWAALAAAVAVIALLVWFLVADRGESEAPAAASIAASEEESSEAVDPPAVAGVADASISGDGATGEAGVEEAVAEPASEESAAMAAEAAAMAATSASLAAESQPNETVVEPATVPAREAAAPVSSAATQGAGATVGTAPADAAPASARARRLVALDHGVDGSTEVLALRFDVPFARDDVFAALIGPDPPRFLLRLRGIEHPWRPPELQVGSPLVERVRTGLHSTPRGPELHIVIDLGTRAIEHSWAIEGDALRVRLTPRAP